MSLIGHEWAVSFVARSHQQGAAAHAYLLVGPPQVGKFTTALAIGRALLCAEVPACGVCRQCLLASHDTHPDLRTLEMPPDRKTIPLNDVHELTQGIALRPLEAAHKVYIIRDADDLSEEGANALLKTIEEPPPTVVILLTALSTSSVPATIVSRCQVLTLRPVAAEVIESYITQRFELTPDRAGALARASRGRPGWAILAAKAPAMLEAQQQRTADMARLVAASRLDRMAYAAELAEIWIKRPDEVRATLETWGELWHAVMLAQAQVSPRSSGLPATESINRIARGLAPSAVREALRATLDALDALDRNANARLVLEAHLLLLPKLAAGG